MLIDANPGLLAMLVGLLIVSAIFSSSETALFSLTNEERPRAGGAVLRLLRRPRRLLIAILLGNLLVNVLFFAFANRLVVEEEPWSEVAVGLVALVAILIGGEILPKTVGLRLRLPLARIAAPPLSGLVVLVRPLGEPLVRFLETVDTAILGRITREPELTSEALAHLLERGAEEGLLPDSDAGLLAEICELDGIRVREIMTPRVDALFLDLDEQDLDQALVKALERKQSWLPVIEGDPDHVVGRVLMRDLYRHAGRPLRQLVMPVKFVPEVASALDLLRGLREDRTTEAVVVDEWGGTAGTVTAEQVFEEIVGDWRTEDEARIPAVVPLGEGRFRVAGGLSIRDWNDHFGLEIVPTEFETVGGFVTALLGRIPRAGDRVRADRLVMQVHSIRGRRVETVDIGVEALAGDLEPMRGES